MSYFAESTGTIYMKSGIEFNEDEIRDIELTLEYFTIESFVENNQQIFSLSSAKNFIEEEVRDDLMIFADDWHESTESGEIHFHGQDGEIWKYTFEDDMWIREEGFLEKK
jgi:hypothetical protein